MDAYTAGLHAARQAAVADSVRALLGMHVEDEPECVSLSIRCTHQDRGLSVIEWELIERNGMAIGGGAL